MGLIRTVVAFASFGVLACAVAAVGQPVPGIPLAEDFDGVTAPSLPSGWVAAIAEGPGPYWVTDAANPDTPPNAAFMADPYVADPLVSSDVRLYAPAVAIATAGAQLYFRQTFSLASGPCGGIPQGRPHSSSSPDGCIFYSTTGRLEISIGGGDFQDIVASGGAFAEGGYNIPGGGWGGQSAAYPAQTTVRVNLPVAAAGTAVALRWRILSHYDLYSGAGEGWRVDSVRVCDGFPCFAVATPASFAIDTGGNGILEAGETVDLDPSYFNGSHGPLDLAGGFGDYGGPPGTSFTVLDGSASYGAIPPLAVGGCASTSDCYSVTLNDPGTRPAQHWDAQFWEDLSNGQVTVWALHVGGSFADVSSTNIFYRDVETVLHRGITGGCGGTSYCPDGAALRKQMAVFLLKAKYGAAYVPPLPVGLFADVPLWDPFAPWIENLYTLGITGGCSSSPLSFCPDQAVLRQQMAVFLLKALNGSGYVPPSCQGLFADVPCPGLFADWVEDLAVRQIAAGCGGGDFCPGNPNTRGQMAVFLDKTFGLTLYGP